MPRGLVSAACLLALAVAMRSCTLLAYRCLAPSIWCKDWCPEEPLVKGKGFAGQKCGKLGSVTRVKVQSGNFIAGVYSWYSCGTCGKRFSCYEIKEHLAPPYTPTPTPAHPHTNPTHRFCCRSASFCTLRCSSRASAAGISCMGAGGHSTAHGSAVERTRSAGVQMNLITVSLFSWKEQGREFGTSPQTPTVCAMWEQVVMQAPLHLCGLTVAQASTRTSRARNHKHAGKQSNHISTQVSLEQTSTHTSTARTNKPCTWDTLLLSCALLQA